MHCSSTRDFSTALLSAKSADGLTKTNLVERPTKLNGEGPGAAPVTALSATPEAPDPDPEPALGAANAAHPENIAAASSVSISVIVRILGSNEVLRSLYT